MTEGVWLRFKSGTYKILLEPTCFVSNIYLGVQSAQISNAMTCSLIKKEFQVQLIKHTHFAQKNNSEVSGGSVSK
jgi:hypothetical protein